LHHDFTGVFRSAFRAVGYVGGLVIDAFANYLQGHSPHSPVAGARITEN